MPREYYSNMLPLKSDIQITYKLLSIRDPALLKHFAELSLDISLLVVESFLTLFTNTCHPDITEVILDYVFLHGSVTLIKAMVLLIGYMKNSLMATESLGTLLIIQVKSLWCSRTR